MFFDGSSAAAYIFAIAVYLTVNIPSCRTVVEPIADVDTEEDRLDALRILSAGNTIIIVCLVGVLVLQVCSHPFFSFTCRVVPPSRSPAHFPAKIRVIPVAYTRPPIPPFPRLIDLLNDIGYVCIQGGEQWARRLEDKLLAEAAAAEKQKAASTPGEKTEGAAAESKKD
ncbi:hypothetical protein C8Q74DRAFT_1246037, partial [Fomes fomentarius]